MRYEWEPRRARRARLIRLAAAVALSASVITAAKSLPEQRREGRDLTT